MLEISCIGANGKQNSNTAKHSKYSSRRGACTCPLSVCTASGSLTQRTCREPAHLPTLEMLTSLYEKKHISCLASSVGKSVAQQADSRGFESHPRQLFSLKNNCLGRVLSCCVALPSPSCTCVRVFSYMYLWLLRGA